MRTSNPYPRYPQFWALSPSGLALALALGLGLALSACGGNKDEAVDTSPVEDAEAPADTDVDDGAIEDASTDEDSSDAAETAPTEAPTEAPTATDEPTEVPTEAPTTVPATLAPTSPPEPTTPPAPAWFVEFYPDNWTYQIPKDQLCAGVNWKSAGVTDLVFGRLGEGFGSEPVEAEGREGDICFPEKEAKFFLEYKKPDGQVERKEFQLERTKNKS